jgi:hypothetical protein
MSGQMLSDLSNNRWSWGIHWREDPLSLARNSLIARAFPRENLVLIQTNGFVAELPVTRTGRSTSPQTTSWHSTMGTTLVRPTAGGLRPDRRTRAVTGATTRCLPDVRCRCATSTPVLLLPTFVTCRAGTDYYRFLRRTAVSVALDAARTAVGQTSEVRTGPRRSRLGTGETGLTAVGAGVVVATDALGFEEIFWRKHDEKKNGMRKCRALANTLMSFLVEVVDVMAL